MQPIGLAVVLAVTVTLAPLSALAQQQTERIYRVGFLTPEVIPRGMECGSTCSMRCGQ